MRMKGWSGSLGWLVELTLYELFYMYEYQIFDLHRVFKRWKVEMDGQSEIREKKD